MHFYRASAEATTVVTELDLRVIAKKGHRYGRIGQALGNHQGGETLSQRVVMDASVPNGDLLGLPCLDRAHGYSAVRNERKVSTA